MKKISIAIISLLFGIFAIGASAQSLQKNQTIEIVIPFGPGGASTQVGQFVAQALRNRGYNAIVVNKPGNNSIIAGNYVAKAAANGHTLIVGTTAGISANPAFHKEQTGMEYDEKSFTPIVLLNQSALGMMVSTDSDIKTYDQFKEFVKKNPSKFNVGTFNSTYGHMFRNWAQKEGLPEPTVIQYKGSSFMVTDVAAGILLTAFDNFGWGAPVLPFIEGDKIRIIATFDNSATRESTRSKNSIVDISRLHPDTKFSIWLGLFAPAGTPKSIVSEINKIVNDSVADPAYRDVVERMDGIGGSPEKLGTLVRRDFNNFQRFANKK